MNGIINEGRPADFLYDLLPRIYRRRDLDEGQPMRAVFAIAQQVYQLLENDIGGLYDNWFVETCDAWVLPYLADLVAIPAELSAERPAADLRRLIANIVDYRRRKGTAGALADVARDVTGWSVHIAESATALARTPFVPVAQTGAAGANVGDLGAMDRLRGPFDLTARTVDVRSFGVVAVSFWRDVPMTLAGVQPAAHAGPSSTALGWWFDPLGRDLPLINPPSDDAPPERGVPARLSNVRLRDDLDPEYPSGGGYFGIAPPAFAIDVQIGASRHTVDPGELVVRDLRTWAPPQDDRVLVDAERGRFVLPAGWTDPRVTATWGTTGPVGGGSYARPVDDETADVDAIVSQQKIVPNVPGRDLVWFATIDEALLYAAARACALVRITIADSATYGAPVQPLSAGFSCRTMHVTVVPNARPVVKGDVTASLATGGRLILDGFVLDGTLTLDAMPQADDVVVTVENATIAPRRGRTAVASATDAGSGVLIELNGAICGPIRVPRVGFRIDASATVVDGAGAPAIAISGAEDDALAVVTSLALDACTVFGDVRALAVTISDSIVTGELTVRGDDDSSARNSMLQSAPGLRNTYRVSFGTPAFVSRSFLRPGYARLALDNPPRVLSGAAGGGELGAFRDVATGRCLANLRATVAEYVPYGMRAEVRDER